MLAPDVARHVDAIREGLAADEQLWVSGPGGSGRTTIVHDLLRAAPDAVLVDLPSLDDADAVAALSLLVLSGLPHDQRDELQRAPFRRIVDAVASRHSLLIVRVPRSWSGSANHQPHHRRARDELARLSGARKVVWVVDGGVDPPSLGAQPDRVISLPVHRVPFDERYDWSSYTEHAGRLARALPPALSLSPQVWRLAVGCVALGRAPREVARLCAEPPGRSRPQMLRSVADSLSAMGHELIGAVAKFVMARRPLPVAVALDIADPPPEHRPLLTECLGYGDPVQVAPSLRAFLARALRPTERRPEADLVGEEQVHLRLASHHRTQDGVRRPVAASGWQSTTAWIEKVHHLAHAGDLGAEEWSEQELPRRELYWDRARYLSTVRKDYAAAARVYEQCAARFPEDDYAHHYRAYNLQRARERVDQEVLDGYEQAVRRAPDNPWWNARKVTALIEARRPVEARRAWARAIERLDPEGARVETDPWLAAHLHYWVAKAWLKSGAWCTARGILEFVPAAMLGELSQLRPDIEGMQERIEQAEHRDWKQFRSWLQAQESESWQPVGAIVQGLREQVPGIPPPVASDGEDGPSLTWSRPGVYLTLEVLGDGRVDWFARDRVDDRTDGVDDPVDWRDDELIRWLEHVRRE